jgi:hypothetical protein
VQQLCWKTFAATLVVFEPTTALSHGVVILQDNAPLSAALQASQVAIGHVNSSMRIVRAALSAADEDLACRALDVATVAVQQAAGRLQAATQLATHELLLPPQQQQLLQQMWRRQPSEGELDDTCCSMYCC